MTTQHTAGPWHIARQTPTERRILVTKDGERVLACCSTGYESPRKGPIPKEERMANARLIAAAPELLAALRALAEISTGGVIEKRETGKPTWYALEEIGKIAATAIAKATGEEVQG